MSSPVPLDDLGLAVPVPPVVRRVVSLVPSLTESVAISSPGLLVGATRWCVRPASLRVDRVGGTKNPDTDRIVALRPDMVLANEEENRPEDLAVLRSAGLAVWVTRVRSVPEALASLETMLTVACALRKPGWLERAAAAWRQPPGTGEPGGTPAETARPVEPARARGPLRRAVVPIWRRPWMVLGSDTFAGDVLARLGVVNVYAGHPRRYPRIGLEELRACGADLVVLPDEPYAFSVSDGPEAFPGIPVALVSGRHLTWYGPSMIRAPAVLGRQLRAARPGGRW